MRSREEILYENYAKVINIEAKTMIEMAGREIIPAVTAYVKDVAKAAAATTAVVPTADVTAEIDIYPNWKRTCIMETELPSKEHSVTFPPYIRIIKEVTGEKQYSNVSMSHSFPSEIDPEI